VDQGLDGDQGLSTVHAPVPTEPVAPLRRGRPGRRVIKFFHDRVWLRLVLLIGAPAAWMLVLYAGALAALFLNSVYRLNEDGSAVEKVLNLDNYRELWRSRVYRDVVVRTVVIAALVTIVDVVLAVPIAFYIAKVAAPRWRSILVAAVLVPLWAGYLVKTFAWRAVLGSPGGVLDKTFGASPGFGRAALVVVLAYLWLPYMIMPVYAGFERLPDSLLEASADLGAGFGFTFRRVALPMVMPSLVAGSVFTFSLSLGDYIAVSLVGGKTQMIGSVVYGNFSVNLPLAAAFGTIPVVIMVLYLVGIRRTGALENL
jgi:putative spermidine/putrescine transport system permease protein